MRYDEPRQQVLRPHERSLLAGGLCLENHTEIDLQFTVTVGRGGQLTIIVRE